MSAERLSSIAVLYKDKPYLGGSGGHNSVIKAIAELFELEWTENDPDPEGAERGFLTNAGRFVGRTEAYAIAVRTNQVRRGSMSEQFGALYSDDFTG